MMDVQEGAMHELEIAKIDLVITNRALARLGAVDAYGHVSLRHPTDPTKFLLSRSLSPEFVEREDLMTFNLDGSKADNGDNRGPYLERFIHAGVYAARPDIYAVVHGHAPPILPFTVSETPMKIVYFGANEVGSSPPVWDIRDKFGDTNMLIANMDHADDLAACLDQHRIVFLRGHGFVGAARSAIRLIRQCKAMMINATMLLDAMRLGAVKELTPGEIAARSAEVGNENSYATFRGFEYEARLAGLMDLLKERAAHMKALDSKD
jgi:HCOMODA/2-hydroxy-3-carboxy-muconic semialdehyde decarboxylase